MDLDDIPLLGERTQRCKRCQTEIEGGPDTCPACQYNPKSKGLRVSMALYLVVVLTVMAMMFVPRIGALLIPVAAVSFVLALVILLVSFAATPHRFGRLFLRP